MDKTTNCRKIAFIVCANNSLYYEECVRYINELIVPENMETDVLCITEAKEMAQAYNAAIESSDAKYKVYLHQDVFIYNKHFIEDILEIFQADDQVGMLGVIGGIELPQDAVIWNAWNIGCTWACDVRRAFPINYDRDNAQRSMYAEAIDGMLMATQYDIKWREDLNLGWDFYDISQSLEFRRRGYKIVVPYQKTPWCFHDCGVSKLSNYDKAREKILAEYKDFFSEDFQLVDHSELYDLEDKMFSKIKDCMESGHFESALEIAGQIDYRYVRNNNLIYAINMLEIYMKEKKNGAGGADFFGDVRNWEAWKNKYDIIKFEIRYIDFFATPEQISSFMQMIRRGEISKYAIQVIGIHNSIVPDKWNEI